MISIDNRLIKEDSKRFEKIYQILPVLRLNLEYYFFFKPAFFVTKSMQSNPVYTKIKKRPFRKRTFPGWPNYNRNLAEKSKQIGQKVLLFCEGNYV